MEGAGLSAKYAAAQLTGIGELQRFFSFFSERKGGKSVPFSAILSAFSRFFPPHSFHV